MKAGIALGSNIEPRLASLREAARRVQALALPNTPVLASRVYETTPVDCPPGSPPFLNAVMEITTSLDPTRLLEHLQKVEIDLGRPTNHGKNAPRPIDLDILYCDDLTLFSEKLTIPHPRLAVRRFVLQPLSDIRPDLRPSGSPKSVAEFLESLGESEELKLIYYSLISSSIS